MATSSNRKRTKAEQEFADWLDTIATPVDTTKPLLDKSRDYAQEKQDKKDKHKHRWLMQNSFWYRQQHNYHLLQEQRRLEAELKGEEYIEPEPLQLGEDGFWEQFTEGK